MGAAVVFDFRRDRDGSLPGNVKLNVKLFYDRKVVFLEG
jgi:hypothetical protein